MSADSVAHQDAEAGASKRRLLSPAGDPLIRAVGRVPAGVHAKLLVAFVGTALLVVVVAVSGFAFSDNPTSVSKPSGRFRRGPLPTASSGATRAGSGLLAQGVEGDFFKVFPELNKEEPAGVWLSTGRS